MIHTQTKVDDIDKVCLIGACMIANELPSRLPKGEISRIGVGELGEFYQASIIALELVAKMHRQAPDDFDGVVWYERLVDASEGSLADLLAGVLVDYPCNEETIREVVIVWLKESGL